MGIQAVPMRYAGQLFRSTLEADWAANFDQLNWWWQYEPVALTVGEHQYRPDFYLPSQRIWAEVKGPHNERMDKAAAFAEALHKQEWDEDEWQLTRQHVVLLRPPARGGLMIWENLLESQRMVIVRCPDCYECGFMNYQGPWICPRGCRNGGVSKFWELPGGQLYFPGELGFIRAPRDGKRVQP